MPTVLAWNAETPDLFRASVDAIQGRPTIHLSAEAIEGQGWGWAAWSDHSVRGSLQGRAASRAAAMKQAEIAARMLLVARVLQAA